MSYSSKNGMEPTYTTHSTLDAPIISLLNLFGKRFLVMLFKFYKNMCR